MIKESNNASVAPAPKGLFPATLRASKAPVRGCTAPASRKPVLTQPAAPAARGRGWHATTGQPPRRGRGTATVQPFRRKREIESIKGVLAHSPRDFALFILGIHTGLRGSDLLRLRWRDLLDSHGDLRARLEITETKTGKLRQVALQPNARDALEKWRGAAKNTTPEAFAFPNAVGGALTIQRLHQLVNAWAERADVTGHFGSHTLRKTYGYHMRRLGVPIETLMKLFGHSSQAITLRYIGVEQDEIDEANLKLSL